MARILPFYGGNPGYNCKAGLLDLLEILASLIGAEQSDLNNASPALRYCPARLGWEYEELSLRLPPH